MLKAKLESLVKKFGPLEKAEKLEPTVAASLRGRIPDGLIEFLLEQGIGLWLKGRFQFCRCDLYDDVCRALLFDDSQFSPEDSAIFGFTAFGKVYVWNRKHYAVLQVNLPRLIASAGSIARERTNPELDISNNLTFINKDHTDMFADTATAPPLFAAAQKKLGELGQGEIYGFVPALAMGGSARITSIKIVKALEHLSLLAGLGRARLMDYSDGKERFIRLLGS